LAAIAICIVVVLIVIVAVALIVLVLMKIFAATKPCPGPGPVGPLPPIDPKPPKEDGNTCICTVYDNDHDQVHSTDIIPKTTKEQCEAEREALKRTFPEPGFTVGCTFAGKVLE
jgi:hypothetical protein